MLDVRCARGATAIENLRQSGSSKLLFPRGPGPGKEAVLINTAGGVTNGDRFTFRGRVGAGASLTITTQAAERAYRAPGPDPAIIRTELNIDSDATLLWLPQETILFDQCAVDRRLQVNLASGATALISETLVFGRAAMGETLRRGDFRDRIEIRRGRDLLFLDALHLTGDLQAQLSRSFGAGGAGAMTLLLLAGPKAEAALQPVRAALPDTAGASLIRDDLLIARILAADSFGLRQCLVPLLNQLTDNRLPRPWMI